MNDNRTVVKTGGGGIGCLTALGLIFIVLKLAQVGVVANWSWWLVLAPFLLQALVLLVFVVIAIIAIALTN